MMLRALPGTPAWIAEDLDHPYLAWTASLTLPITLIRADEALSNCVIEDFQSSRTFPAVFISSAIILTFSADTARLSHLAYMSTTGD